MARRARAQTKGSNALARVCVRDRLARGVGVGIHRRSRGASSLSL